MHKHSLLLFLLAILLLSTACSSDSRFTKISASKSGVDFENTLVEDTTFNFLNYLYFYNGGGVAAGDINNDGLDDLFFTSNQGENRLYLNKGDFKFDDITEMSGIIHQPESWSSGVAMVDLNGDGWLDIYVSNVNYLSRAGKNQVFINNQDGSFTDKAKELGLDLEAYSVQAAFLDYDKDGDLDVFQLNHSVHSIYSYTPIESRDRVDSKSGDRLFRNDGATFVDVSEEAGIYSSALGFGLGITVSDFNNDGWPDIYVGNDFHEDDYLYINQKDGTFEESIRESVRHLSQFTMSVDVGDINNDGRKDIVTTDMLPYEEEILKKSGGGDTYQVARIKESYGYYPQYSRNMLQLNVGNDNYGAPIFSEIGYFAGIEATDWSWSGLLADLDNDGWRDFYVANGIYRRPNDLDYIKYISSSDIQSSLQEGINPENLKLVQKMPRLQIANAVFQNNGDLTFQDQSEEWGLGEKSYSNGTAYADLDNDGDLDLIVNNVNQPAFLYRNETNSTEVISGNFLQFHLMGDDKNTSGVGTKVIAYVGEEIYSLEQMPVRGFQSSVSHVLHIGLGEQIEVDSVRVIWPNDKTQLLTDVGINTLVHLNQMFAQQEFEYHEEEPKSVFFEDITSLTQVDFKHTEDEFVDFDNERLIPHYQSTLGPPIAVADVNADGLDDFFVGNASLQTGEIWIQNQNGTFRKKENPDLFEDRFNEDTDAIFFDANGDDYPDLLVTSGGGRIVGQFRELLDRLYINDGSGTFYFSNGMPATYANSSTVSNGDFDNDGDQDLFIGGLSIPGIYGLDPVSFLLQNDGAGNFTDVTDIIAPQLRNPGMITDSEWLDSDQDGDLDLILAGEWMPITIYSNILNEVANSDTITTIFTNVTSSAGLANTSGWWNTLEFADLDQDGDLDILAGNLGLNSYLKASTDEPIKLYLNDYDKDQKGDPIVVRFEDGKEYPIAMVDELFSQMSSMRRGFISYEELAKKSFNELFEIGKIDSAIQKRVEMFESIIVENNGDGTYGIKKLPSVAQFSPIYSFYISDLNNDGNQDIYLNGNFSGVKPFFGQYDANYGSVLINDGQLNFNTGSIENIGVLLKGEIRDTESIIFADGEIGIIVSQNDGELIILKQNQ